MREVPEYVLAWGKHEAARRALGAFPGKWDSGREHRLVLHFGWGKALAAERVGGAQKEVELAQEALLKASGKAGSRHFFSAVAPEHAPGGYLLQYFGGGRFAEVCVSPRSFYDAPTPSFLRGEKPYLEFPGQKGGLAVVEELMGVQLFVVMAILRHYSCLEGGKAKALSAWASGSPEEWLPCFDTDDGVSKLVKRMAS